MEWVEKEPVEPGKYIVETETVVLKIRRRFDSYWNGKKWSFTNQVFIRYLKEK